MGIEHSEALTRKYKIDKLLVAAGWKIVPYKEGESPRSYNKCAVTEYPTNSGPADYVLVLDEEPLAIVEAKKGAVGVYNVLEQAKRYARGTLFSCWENCLRLAPKPPCPSSSHSPCVGGVRHPP